MAQQWSRQGTGAALLIIFYIFFGATGLDWVRLGWTEGKVENRGPVLRSSLAKAAEDKQNFGGGSK